MSAQQLLCAKCGEAIASAELVFVCDRVYHPRCMFSAKDNVTFTRAYSQAEYDAVCAQRDTAVAGLTLIIVSAEAIAQFTRDVIAKVQQP